MCGPRPSVWLWRNLGHVQTLRAARRRAFHASEPRRTRWAERLRTATLSEVEEEAARQEAALADLHGVIARALAPNGHPGGPVLAEIAEEEAATARALSNAPSGAGGGAAPSHDPLPTEPKALMDLALERLERAAELYLTLAETSRNEDVVAAAQRLSQTAVGRLDRLR